MRVSRIFERISLVSNEERGREEGRSVLERHLRLLSNSRNRVIGDEGSRLRREGGIMCCRYRTLFQLLVCDLPDASSLQGGH